MFFGGARFTVDTLSTTGAHARRACFFAVYSRYTGGTLCIPISAHQYPLPFDAFNCIAGRSVWSLAVAATPFPYDHLVYLVHRQIMRRVCAFLIYSR